MLLNVGDDDEFGSLSDKGPNLKAPDGHADEFLQPKISLHSVMGLTNSKTIKKVVRIGRKEVVVMINPSATHNFILTTTVDKILILLTLSRAFGYHWEMGNRSKGKGFVMPFHCTYRALRW